MSDAILGVLIQTGAMALMGTVGFFGGRWSTRSDRKAAQRATSREEHRAAFTELLAAVDGYIEAIHRYQTTVAEAVEREKLRIKTEGISTDKPWKADLHYKQIADEAAPVEKEQMHEAINRLNAAHWGAALISNEALSKKVHAVSNLVGDGATATHGIGDERFRAVVVEPSPTYGGMCRHYSPKTDDQEQTACLQTSRRLRRFKRTRYDGGCTTSSE